MENDDHAHHLAASAHRMVAGASGPRRISLHVKVDLAPVEVYAFTPKGRVLETSARRYDLDCAHGHTEWGTMRRRQGERQNGCLCAMKSTSGDVVEILTKGLLRRWRMNGKHKAQNGPGVDDVMLSLRSCPDPSCGDHGLPLGSDTRLVSGSPGASGPR